MPLGPVSRVLEGILPEMAKSTQHQLARHTVGSGSDSTYTLLVLPAALPAQGMSATKQHAYCMPKGGLGQLFLLTQSPFLESAF